MMVMTHESGFFARRSRAEIRFSKENPYSTKMYSGSQFYWEEILESEFASTFHPQKANNTTLDLLWPRLQVLFQAAANPNLTLRLLAHW